MKPRDAIRDALQTYVAPRLERLEFSFAPSSLSFLRRRGHFTQRIETQLDQWNAEDVSASFGVRFTVRSGYYSKWHEEQFGAKPANDYVASENYWNLRGWKHAKPQVAHPEGVELEMLQLMEDILDTGLPFLDRYSNWERSARRIVAASHSWLRACDFYMIANNRDAAYEVLQKALIRSREQPRGFGRGETGDLEIRFQKFFGEHVTFD